jgi:translocation and assembly module TamB
VTDAVARPRWRRWGKYLLIVVALGILFLGGLAWYATTDSFQARVRERFIAEMERATGGRVEVGGLHTIPFRFLIDIRNLTVHGREADNEAPYAHVDRVVAKVKIISVLSTEFGFSSIVFNHPVIHVITYPDGTTNQPEPKRPSSAVGNPVEALFSMSIGYLDVRHGELLWNDQSIPLDFTVSDVSANLTYSFLHRRYHGDLLLGKVDTHYDGYRPFAWMLETHFVLSQNRLEVGSLTWRSNRSRLEASGQLEDFRQPKLDATYSLSLDLAEAAAVARRRDLRGGTLQLEGKGSWSLEDFSSAGKLLLKEFEWRDERLALRNANLNAQFTINPQRLTLTQLQARLLGGSASGDAEVTNWRTTSPPAKLAKGKKPAEQQGGLRLRWKDISASALAEALSTPALPLSRMKLAGAAGGTIDARWQGSPRRAEAQIALDMVPASGFTPGQMPVSGHARATYRGAAQELEVADLSFSTRATQIRASGSLSASSSLKLSASTTDLNEWQPVINVFYGPTQIPVRLHGHATFNGAASGKLSDITVAGNLQVEDFDTLLPATAGMPERQVHWDALTVNLQASPRHFAARNGMLRRGDTRLGFDLSAGLQNGRFLEQSPFTLHLDIRNADAAELQPFAGYNQPLAGRMDLLLQAGGTRADPRGDGHLTLTNGILYGEPIEHLSSDLRLGGGEVQLNNLDLQHYNGRIAGGLAYNPSTRAFRFNLTGEGFNLAHIPRLQVTRVVMDGRMDFTARGSGTLDAPVINANIRLHDLAFDHERAGDFTFDATTQGSDMHLVGRSQFAQAELAIDGDIHLREDWPADVDLHFQHLDIDPLLRSYLYGRATGHSAMAGDVHLRGPLRQPRQLNVAANLSELYVDVDNIKLHNEGPVRFAMSNELLNIEQLHLVGDGTDLSGSGQAQLSGDRQLNLRAQGQVNLKLIQTLSPDFTSSGMVTVAMTVSGTISQPLAQGRLQVQDGAVTYADLPSGLSEVNGTLLFNQNRLQIESLTAHTGGGLLTLGGDVTYYNHLLNFNLNGQGQDVRLRYPPGVSSTANANLRLTGNSSAATLTGDVTVTKLAMTPGFDFGQYLARSKQSVILPQTNSYLNRVRLDVHLVTTPELQMQTAVAKLSGDADLHVRGTVARPSVLGRVDILEGEVYFNGTKYRLERGDISFANPVSITPVLDLQATTRVRDYDITVNLNGPPEAAKLKAKWRSEPPLPESDIIALLALGRTQEESAQLQQSGQSPLSQEASNAILGEALNATVSSRAQRLFGVSRIKIDPQGLSTETNPNRGPQVTIEQQVASNLTLTYSTNVSQTSQQIIQAEYNVTRNVSIVAVRDQNGVFSIDVKIRQRKK